MASFPVAEAVATVPDESAAIGVVVGALQAFNLGAASTDPWLKPGVLNLEILSGAKLIAKDKGFLRSGKSDPYVKIMVDGKLIGRTKTVKKSLDPTWGHKVAINVTKATQIVLEVWDSDEIGKDDAMGELTVALGPALSATGARVERDLVLVPHGGCKVSGSLKIAATFRPFSKVEAMQNELNLPKDIVNDLVSLEQTDVVVIADDSGSMNTRNDSGATRWEELQDTLRALLHLLIVVDHHDGFLLKFLNNDAWFTVDSSTKLEQCLKSLPRPSKATPLLSTLVPIVNGAGPHPENETLLFIMTDGKPSDGTVMSIQQLLQGRKKSVFVSFLMCTDDDETVEMYNKCVDPVWGCDITDDYKSERKECAVHGNDLTYHKWLAKAVLGGKMGHKYDALDERRV